jgi:thiamine-phosphate pyrophosphorylase
VLADDDPRWGRDPVAQARAACAGGAAVVQLRAKHATDREALAWARALRGLTRRAGALLLVNDRFDLALAAEADGVHLGQEDLPPRRIPPALRVGLVVGRSTHTLEEARAAREEGVDYVAFGPVFGTTSKDSACAARGLGMLREAAALASPLPLVAIGGIDAANAASAIAAGAAAIAVISAVAGAADPERATRELARAVAEARRG